MKRTTSFFIILLISVSSVCASGLPDFKSVYANLDSLPNISRLVYHGDFTSVWTDSVTFVFKTRDAEGEKCYSVNISRRIKSEIPEDSLKAIKARLAKSKSVSPDEEEFKIGKKAVPQKSPDGKFEAFVKDNNVWIKPLPFTKESKEIQLSFDGTKDDYYIELYWSPDSKKIAAIRYQYVKERQIPLISSAPENQIQPTLRWLDYFKPGDFLPKSRLALFDAQTRKQIAIDTRNYEDQYFLNFGKWLADSKHFTFEYNQRGHQLYQLNTVNAADGSIQVLTEERTNTFVYYYDLYRYYFNDGKRILWISERDNWRHLYLIDSATTDVKQLTKGDWNVRDILKVNEEDNYILFTANGMNAISEKGGKPKGEDPYNKHLMKLDIQSGKLSDLTPEEANHEVYFNDNFTAFVDIYSKPDTPQISLVRSLEPAKNNVLMKIQKADISALKAAGWTTPEVFVAKGRDGKTDIWGNIYRPMNFDAKKKYPVIEYIYAGPHDSFVEKSFYPYLHFQKLMELGFIVVTIDGMGTDNRSKSFQDVCWRNLKDSGFPDRILWIKAAAAKYGYMDTSRGVGIYGYSAGGQSTMAALLFHGDFYKMGVALCGCHDNRMDKIWWNEQWMGYPIGPWYSENSNVDNAWRLPDDDHLMLVNAEMDDNVDPSSTMQVVNALMKADKEFTQYYVPMHNHYLLPDRWVTRQVYHFFYENMK